MEETTSLAPPTPHLDESEAERSVYVTTDQEDRFFLPMREAVQHIRVGESWKVWAAEFNAVLDHVHAWATRHRASLATCRAVIKDGSKVRVLVSPASAAFDCDIADAAVTLELELLAVSRLVDSHVSQLPLRMVEDAVAAAAADRLPSFDLLVPPR